MLSESRSPSPDASDRSHSTSPHAHAPRIDRSRGRARHRSRSRSLSRGRGYSRSRSRSRRRRHSRSSSRSRRRHRSRSSSHRRNYSRDWSRSRSRSWPPHKRRRSRSARRRSRSLRRPDFHQSHEVQTAPADPVPAPPLRPVHSTQVGKNGKSIRAGMTKLYWNGYDYTRANISQIKISFRCSFYRSETCAGRLEYHFAQGGYYDYKHLVPHTCSRRVHVEVGQRDERPDDILAAMDQEINRMAAVPSTVPQDVWLHVSRKFLYSSPEPVVGLSRTEVFRRFNHARDHGSGMSTSENGETNETPPTTADAAALPTNLSSSERVVESPSASSSVAPSFSLHQPHAHGLVSEAPDVPRTRNRANSTNGPQPPVQTRCRANPASVAPAVSSSSLRNQRPVGESGLLTRVETERARLDDRNRAREPYGQDPGTTVASGAGQITRGEFQALMREVQASRQERAELKQQVASLTAALEASDHERGQASDQIALLTAMIEEGQHERMELKLAELHTAIEIERADRTREYGALLDTIEQIVNTSELGSETLGGSTI